MKRLVYLSLIAMYLALAAAGCGKALCEEAWDKAQECVANMKCNITDPLQRPQCENAKQAALQFPENVFKLACDEVEAQKFVDCALDPLTCKCP